jgi:hypothetical protein
LGQEVYAGNFISEQITLNTIDLTNGVYLIKVMTPGKVLAKKLIVQH